jgi:hypothetical protein
MDHGLRLGLVRFEAALVSKQRVRPQLAASVYAMLISAIPTDSDGLRNRSNGDCVERLSAASAFFFGTISSGGDVETCPSFTPSSISVNIVPLSETGDGSTPGVAGDFSASMAGFAGGFKASGSVDLSYV